MARRTISISFIVKITLFGGVICTLFGCLLHEAIISDFLFGLGILSVIIGVITHFSVPKTKPVEHPIIFDDN
ncbi:hypothetical protein [Candidatus Lokiarchaeum ossiferum]